MPRKNEIAFFSADRDPVTDEPNYHLKPHEAQYRADCGYVVWVSDNAVQQRTLTSKSAIEKFAGWSIASWMRDSALNCGRAGQFTIGYPIPYAYEGHLKPNRAAIINADPDQLITELTECLA